MQQIFSGLLYSHGIESVHGLVQNEQLGFMHDGRSQTQALFHPKRIFPKRLLPFRIQINGQKGMFYGISAVPPAQPCQNFQVLPHRFFQEAPYSLVRFSVLITYSFICKTPPAFYLTRKL